MGSTGFNPYATGQLAVTVHENGASQWTEGTVYKVKIILIARKLSWKKSLEVGKKTFYKICLTYLPSFCTIMNVSVYEFQILKKKAS